MVEPLAKLVRIKDHKNTVIYSKHCGTVCIQLPNSWHYSLFTFSWPWFESGSLRNGGMLILRIYFAVWGKLDRRFVD